MVYATGNTSGTYGVMQELIWLPLSVVFSQLSMEYPHILLLGKKAFFCWI